jgi:hypothetical protein
MSNFTYFFKSEGVCSLAKIHDFDYVGPWLAVRASSQTRPRTGPIQTCGSKPNRKRMQIREIQLSDSSCHIWIVANPSFEIFYF